MSERRKIGRRKIGRRKIGWIVLALATLTVPAAAPPAAAQSVAKTVEAIQHARITTRILFVTAHPDDEPSALLTYLARGLGADVALLTITRGQGGQNAVGPEQGDQLGMVRTAELLAADRHYGVEQFFTRAPDFGFSKSAAQALRVWDGMALEDMVRVIRTFRPQIVINGWGGVAWGHGQHQASGVLTPQAVAEAANPKAFPEQLREGLRPWHVSLLLEPARGNTSGAYRVPTDEVSPLWGKSYLDLGIEGHSLHRSQGVTAFFEAAFFRRPTFLQVEGNGKLDPAELAEPLPSLAERFPKGKEILAPGLMIADRKIELARQQALALRWPEAAKELAGAGKEIVKLSRELAARPGSEARDAEGELAEVRRRIDVALADTAALDFEARADRYALVAGERFSVHLDHSQRLEVPLEFQRTELLLPADWKPGKEEKDPSGEGVRITVAIPAGATPPVTSEEAILPWPPPLVRARLDATLFGYSFSVVKPVAAVKATSTSVDMYPLQLVPKVSLSVEPRQVMLPEKAIHGASAIQLLARVRFHGSSPARVAVGVDVPAGWSVAPVSSLEFATPGDQLVRFSLKPPARLTAGAYVLKPYARVGEAVFRTSIAPLPTLPTRLWSEPAEAIVHVLNLDLPENLRVGYIAAGNDPIPDILRQLGMRVDLLDESALAFGDLNRYDAIVVGIRAYELRGDVARSNPRLLNYVERGGTLVVQYQHGDVWNRLQPAPFPATMPAQTSRTTDANSPVRFLAPDCPLLERPNRITPADFLGWVQERGLYYWTEFDPRYQAVLALRDPGEEEALGSLVYARDGKGFYIYTGLSFFRQLPAGVPGAFRLFVNLLSQSKLAGENQSSDGNRRTPEAPSS